MKTGGLRQTTIKGSVISVTRVTGVLILVENTDVSEDHAAHIFRVEVRSSLRTLLGFLCRLEGR
jgi:hypothetical protein